MKKIFFLLALTPLYCYSYNSDSTRHDTIKKSKFSLGLSVNSQYCYRSLYANSSNATLLSERNAVEAAKFGGISGLDVALKMSRAITFESGIMVSDQGYRSTLLTVEYPNGIGIPYPSFSNKTGYTLYYYYLSIPFKVDYYLPVKNFQLFISAGLSANISLGEQIQFDFGGISSGNTPESFMGYTGANLAMLASIGFNYPLSKKTTLKIEPNFMRALTPIVNEAIKEYTYSVGLTIGVLVYP